MIRKHIESALVVLSAMVLAGCETLGLPGDVVRVDDDTVVFVTAQSTSLAIVASEIQSTYPNIEAANDATSPKWVDSHPAGLNRGELAGFGVTMIAHDGTEPFLNFNTIRDATGDLRFPNLLFFRKAKGEGKPNWNVIGMAYSMPYEPGPQPVLHYAGADVSDFFYRFLIHEAGYHVVTNGNFRCAENDDLRNDAVDAGKSITPAARDAITRDDLKTDLDAKRHGRYWTLHVWFDPDTGRPAIAPTDPWNRQDEDARVVPDCAFYYDD